MLFILCHCQLLKTRKLCYLQNKTYKVRDEGLVSRLMFVICLVESPTVRLIEKNKRTTKHRLLLRKGPCWPVLGIVCGCCLKLDEIAYCVSHKSAQRTADHQVSLNQRERGEKAKAQSWQKTAKEHNVQDCNLR